ncbi:MAG: GatB/YqeY domain-containing protein [Candidatus Krumholzibacteriota bacterium]|nr:GatB/YqeY domain-containing protein [Candidatus Krumholzibacteriota bacterium]
MQERLLEDLKTALKAGDRQRVSVLRMLRSELKNAEIARGEALGDAEVLDVLSRYARKRKESAAEYERGARPDLVAKEMAEHDIVQAYLPAALSEAELGELVDAVIGELGATGLKQMGPVMKEVLARAAGRAEGGTVSALVKARLGG